MAKPRKVSNIVRMPENRKPAYWRARPAQIIILPMIRTGWDRKATSGRMCVCALKRVDRAIVQ
jgi:hypothetical protein